MSHIRFRLFNWIELPFALFSAFFILGSIYLTFTTFFIGLFIPPIVAVLIAGAMIRWINPEARGTMFLYHALALSGVFLALFSLLVYQMVAPLFGVFGQNTGSETIKQTQVLTDSIEAKALCEEKCGEGLSINVVSNAPNGYILDKSEKPYLLTCFCKTKPWFVYTMP
jgi:hypothetical protein